MPTNADFLAFKKRKKYFKDKTRRLERKLKHIGNTLDVLEGNIRLAEMVDEVYDGVALHEFSFLGTGWVRCDQYESHDEYRCGRYWDNAHNPGKGEWNMELEISSWRGGFRHKEQKFFAFSFGTEEQCAEAIKQWVVHGKLPKEKKA